MVTRPGVCVCLKGSLSLSLTHHKQGSALKHTQIHTLSDEGIRVSLSQFLLSQCLLSLPRAPMEAKTVSTELFLFPPCLQSSDIMFTCGYCRLL